MRPRTQGVRTTVSGGRREAAPHRIGIVGCGNVAVRKHVPAWLSLPDRFRVVAVADPSPTSREAVRELLGLDAADAHEDWESLLRRDDLDIADICTPQHLRHAAVTEAIGHGKHVLAEKPLGIRPLEAADITARARAQGVTVGTTHNYLFFPEVVAARQVVADGEIGQVETAILNYLGVIYRPGTGGYKPAWRHLGQEAGGGVLMDMLHGLYLAEAFLGRPIRRVSAYVDAKAPGAEIEDTALCRLETDSNAALVNVAWGNGPGSIDVSGTEGRLAVRYENGGTSPFAPVDSLTVTTAQGSRTVPLEDRPDYWSFAVVFEDFAAAIEHGRDPIAPPETASHTLQLVFAAYKAAALQRSIDVPLEPSDPVYRSGLAGLAQLDIPSTSPVRRREIFGVSPDRHETAPAPSPGSGA